MFSHFAMQCWLKEIGNSCLNGNTLYCRYLWSGLWHLSPPFRRMKYWLHGPLAQYKRNHGEHNSQFRLPSVTISKSKFKQSFLLWFVIKKHFFIVLSIFFGLIWLNLNCSIREGFKKKQSGKFPIRGGDLKISKTFPIFLFTFKHGLNHPKMKKKNFKGWTPPPLYLVLFCGPTAL